MQAMHCRNASSAICPCEEQRLVVGSAMVGVHVHDIHSSGIHVVEFSKESKFIHHCTYVLNDQRRLSLPLDQGKSSVFCSSSHSLQQLSHQPLEKYCIIMSQFRVVGIHDTDGEPIVGKVALSSRSAIVNSWWKTLVGHHFAILRTPTTIGGPAHKMV